MSGSVEGFDPEENKIALVLGAVNGANYCNYTSQIMQQLQADGFRVVLVHYRNFKIHSPPNGKDPKVRSADEAQVFRGLLFDGRPEPRGQAREQQVPASTAVPGRLLDGLDPVADVAGAAERQAGEPGEGLRGHQLSGVSGQGCGAHVALAEPPLREQHDQGHAQDRRRTQRAGRRPED